MRIYISADMEGVSGVTHSSQCRPDHPDYARFRRLMTAEVNAAIEGALAAGATEALVNDSHFRMTNILLEELHPAAALISGTNKLLCQMEGIDDSFACVFFVGYHEGDGLGDGVLNHTLMSAAIREVRINGVTADEAAINARIAGCFGVPVAFISGDDRVCATAADAYPGIETASIKRAVDRLSAESRPIQAAHALIRERAAAAVEKVSAQKLAPVASDPPVRFDIEFRSTSAAHMCTLFPGVERTGPTTIGFAHDDFLDAFRHFWGLGIVALSAQEGLFGA